MRDEGPLVENTGRTGREHRAGEYAQAHAGKMDPAFMKMYGAI